MERDVKEGRPVECCMAMDETSWEINKLGKALREEEKMCPRGFDKIAFCLTSKWRWQGGREHGHSLEELGRQGRCSSVHLPTDSHLQHSIRRSGVSGACEMIALVPLITPGHRTHWTFLQAIVSCHSLLDHWFRVSCLKKKSPVIQV